MTLFTLLIVMALERVVSKSKSWHIASFAEAYFFKLQTIFFKHSSDAKDTKESEFGMAKIILIAAFPAIIIWLLLAFLPGFLVFILYIATLWVCLGCPYTRKVYKGYLQAASRKDLQACSLHSEEFGNSAGDLSEVGKLLVFINYRHYAAVIIFFVLLGLPGLVFYCFSSEWLNFRKRQISLCTEKSITESESLSDENKNSDNKIDDFESEEVDAYANLKAANMLMLILDWVPARITALGFLVVGHFSSGLPVWLETFATPNLSAYEILGKVAKASEEVNPCENYYLQEPLQMVKLVKRNVVFLLMSISAMTLIGLIG